jgi:alkaline phosphatase D
VIAEAVAAVVSHGPFIGHVTPESALVWARAAEAGAHVLHVGDLQARAVATPETDLAMVFRVEGLTPGTTYRCQIEHGEQTTDDFALMTPSADEESVAIAFGSCADATEGAQATWARIGAVSPDVVVLLGDTPYIDTTDLAVQRRRYREFAAIPALAAVLQRTSWYGTWDDHDFGRNDTDGNLPGKERSRQAFIEHHANPSYGNGEHGIYTSFRRGPVEVFLLDTRYFAATGPSPAASDLPTLLGKDQWQWLLDGLERSTAPFKVLASGMIWNGATRPNKPDHWETYAHERDALFDHIGERGITGVVLVGGDIHRSRVVRHDTAERTGFALTELITSPMHAGIIETANAPHPGLLWDAGAPNTFLLLQADATTLTAEFHDATGAVLHTQTLPARDLAPRR